MPKIFKKYTYIDKYTPTKNETIVRLTRDIDRKIHYINALQKENERLEKKVKELIEEFIEKKQANSRPTKSPINAKPTRLQATSRK